MTEAEREPSRRGLKWDTLGTGADLWATVVMASGFVLPAGQEVREHYRIVRPLGAGGMGQVLGVVLVGSPDPQMYALKMVARPQEGRPLDAADRAAVDAQQKAFAALLRGEAAKQEVVQRHGVAVARLFALVRFEDGSLGLRMEVARGRSLESVLDEELRRRKHLTPDFEFALVVMRKVLGQLRRLHELVEPASPSGFVHSDMKPGNIFVDDGDRQDPFITLLDFGVSTAGHALEVDFAAGRKSLVLNDAGGTFGYAPPHHFTGKPTPLSDVYAAIVILYEMLALQSPWDFGGLAKTPVNLFKLEDAMRKGPQPVRSGREAIPGEAATVLDGFFGSTFSALHALADEAHAARASADDSARRAMTDRMRGLALDYQTRLDTLRAQLTGRTTDPGARVSLERAETAIATPSVDPQTVIESRPRVRTPPPDYDEPVDVPMQPLFGWKTAMLLLGIAGGVFVAVRGLPPPVSQWVNQQWSNLRGTHAPPPPTDHTAVAPPPSAHLDAAVATPVAVVDAGHRALPPPPVAIVDAGAPLVAAVHGVDAAVTLDVAAVQATALDAAPDVRAVAEANLDASDVPRDATAIAVAAADVVPIAADSGTTSTSIDQRAAHTPPAAPPAPVHPVTPPRNTHPAVAVHPHPVVTHPHPTPSTHPRPHPVSHPNTRHPPPRRTGNRNRR